MLCYLPVSLCAGASPPASVCIGRGKVLTLALWDEKRILLRIGHQFGIGEDSTPLKLLVRQPVN